MRSLYSGRPVGTLAAAALADAHTRLSGRAVMSSSETPESHCLRGGWCPSTSTPRGLGGPPLRVQVLCPRAGPASWATCTWGQEPPMGGWLAGRWRATSYLLGWASKRGTGRGQDERSQGRVRPRHHCLQSSSVFPTLDFCIRAVRSKGSTA